MRELDEPGHAAHQMRARGKRGEIGARRGELGRVVHADLPDIELTGDRRELLPVAPGGNGHELDMGTPFDAFTPLSHHGRTDIAVDAQRNRLLLMGLMTAAGWDFYRNEWWHYQLFDARGFALISDADLPRPMM